MLHTKFQACEASGSGEEDFFYVFPPSMGQTQDPIGRGHFGTCDLHLNKPGKGQLGSASFQISII